MRFVAIYAVYLTVGFNKSVEIFVTLYIWTGSWWRNNMSISWTDRAFVRQWQALLIGPDWKWEMLKLEGEEMLTCLLCSWPLQCRCHPGFQLKRDGKTCVDIDECTTTYPCSQRCINTHGSFHCLCVDGFELSPNDPTICKSTSGKACLCVCFAFCCFFLSRIVTDSNVFCLVFVCRRGALLDLC